MSAANSQAPEVIGNYFIEAALAHGSMGTVYVARHSLTYARVALKVLRTEPVGDRQAEERFLREVRAAAQIGHDGIVKVQDAGKTADGHLYLAMELLTGETLEERIARSSGERLTAMDWLLAVLEPLAAAHARSIVHRDLKPANVFIARSPDGSDHIKLLDFGLARDTREKSGTQTGIALGTPYYMSPEQAARPKDVSPASDVWSMGVMMYEILTGCMPFDGETLHAVVIQAATTPHVPTRDRAPTLDPELAALVDACLSKQPAHRPRDANELLQRLYPLLEDETVRADLAKALTSEPLYEDDEPPRDPRRMPFADTAIALAHDSRIQDVYPRAKNSGLGVWISTFALLALMISGFFWALERSFERTTGARAAPPAPAATRTSAPQLPRSPAAAPAPGSEGAAPMPTPALTADVPAETPADLQPPAASGSRRGYPRSRDRAHARRNPTGAESAAESALADDPVLEIAPTDEAPPETALPPSTEPAPPAAAIEELPPSGQDPAPAPESPAPAPAPNDLAPAAPPDPTPAPEVPVNP